MGFSLDVSGLLIWRETGVAVLMWSLSTGAGLFRYLISAGLVVGLVHWGAGDVLVPLQQSAASRLQRDREFWQSVSSIGIFALFVVTTFSLERMGLTQIYRDESMYPLWYLPVSLVLALALHDTYFYWTHRLMHRVRIFRQSHLHHHASKTPTAWAAFAFHPLEACVQGSVYLWLPLILPIHISVLTLFALVATLHSAWIHSGHDLRGNVRKRSESVASGIWSGSLEHDLHHAGAKGNFGLYFLFWDRWMGTLRRHP